MCSDAAKEAEDHRESLKNSLAKMNNEIESMALLLGELCPSFPNVRGPSPLRVSLTHHVG